MTGIRWAKCGAPSPRWVAAFAVGLPHLIAGLHVQSNAFPALLLAMSLVLASAAGLAVAQPSLKRGMTLFAAVQLPHFAAMVYYSLRNGGDLSRPYGNVIALPGWVSLVIALSDLLELGLVGAAWSAGRAKSEAAADRFLTVCGIWLLGTGLMRWPPMLVALEMNGWFSVGEVPEMPLRSVIQIAVAVLMMGAGICRASLAGGHRRDRP